ncbi:MAG: dihydrofolate reductase [Sphingobacteriaceae bacterium]|nr:dihydrofolate reductase [Cytophagaceae bacterium]
MRKVILQINVSLDGFIEAPNQDLDWMYIDEEQWQTQRELRSTADTALFGRVAYQGFEQYWPGAATNPESPKQLVDFAHWIDETPKIVFSTTLSSANWANSRLVKSDIAAEIANLKQQPGKNLLLFGGADIDQTFINLGLVDDYRINVYPIVLGNGIPLFKNLNDRAKLKLLDTKTYQSGVVGLHYEPEK